LFLVPVVPIGDGALAVGLAGVGVGSKVLARQTDQDIIGRIRHQQFLVLQQLDQASDVLAIIADSAGQHGGAADFGIVGMQVFVTFVSSQARTKLV
jgi:hypothetical protein